ncbi:hypothetical protein CIW83_10940 [Tissierella sp. P1]|uniref:DUF917 domain-containing protein n=1 Tax=Tissierella sp. P1 TaxID=1280483 RepID=UPI000BA06298|nr:DUF917 domain-containing protein [Tissierella sp. P1]OZV12133.1 hypothetical protein CIW83_10940 [Tissierella sp. P1]
MATKSLTNRVEVEDFVRGCTFYGTGGGGLPSNGIDSLMSEIEKGNKVGWIDVNEIDDDAITVCPFLMGSIAPHIDEVKKEMKGFGLTDSVNKEKERLGKAVAELSKYTGKKIGAVVPIELGGANTPGPLAAGILNGIPCVDGDYTGRAIPEILQTTPYINGKVLWPVASVDEFDNICIIDKAINYRMVERIGKLIASGAYGLAGQAGFLMTGKEMKEIIIPGTLTECYELGKMIRESRENDLNPIDEIIKKLDGYLLAKGTVTGKDTEDKLGYYWGTHTIIGKEEFKDNIYKIWFKNENHIMWENDKPIITSPDIIVVVDAKTGEPYANPVLKVGDEVCVIGLKAREIFKSEKGIGVLGPRYFGYDIDYMPIEERL